MNRFAPPASDVQITRPTWRLGTPGWVASTVLWAYVLFAALDPPASLHALKSAYLFIPMASVFVVIGYVLLLARLPSSTLLFAAASTSSLLGFSQPLSPLLYPCLLASVGCLLASLAIFFPPSRWKRREA